MKLYIPELGDKLTLDKDWTFTLEVECRNQIFYHLPYLAKLAATIKQKYPGWEMDSYIDYMGDAIIKYTKTGYTKRIDAKPLIGIIRITLPKGTVLTVDRVYIRKGASEFSSITFRIASTTHPDLAGKKKNRFWAKLADVNTMEIV